MAGASDPLEDMLFSEVDEKAVSDLVGSLESQLAGQSNPTGTAGENGGSGSVAPANHHLGKTLPAPAPVNTTAEQQQQQGRRTKAEMRQEINSKEVIPDTSVTAAPVDCSCAPGEPSTTSAGCVSATTHGASITTPSASTVSTLASISSTSTVSAASRSSKDSSDSGEASAESNAPKRRLTAVRRSASARIRSLNGAALTTRRSSTNVEPAAATPTSTSTSSSFSVTTLPVGQSSIALDRGTPTISLQRLPSHIVASIAQNGSGTSVSAIAQHNAPAEAASHSSSPESISKTPPPGTGTPTTDCQSKSVPSTSSSSVINTVSSGPTSVSAVTTSTSATTTTKVTHPQSSTTTTITTITTTTTSTSTTTAAAAASAVSTTSGCGTAQSTSVTTTVSTIRPAAPSPSPTMVTTTQCQPRPGLPAPQRMVAPQLIVRPPQQQTTIQLPPGFTIPSGMVLVRTELGQLVMVPQQALAQAQAQAQAQNSIAPRPTTPTTATSFRVTAPQSSVTSQTTRQCTLNTAKMAPPPSPTPSSTALQTTSSPSSSCSSYPALRPKDPIAVTAPQQTPVVMAPQAPAQPASQPPQTGIAGAAGGPVVSQEMQENVKKCKNFLATLIKLASHNSPSPETSKNVKALVQDLLDAKIEPEEFTSRLQTELKSSPQPYLVPFLKKSLPALRLSLLNSQQSLTQPPQQGVKPVPAGSPPAIVTGPAVRIRHPNSVSNTTCASVLPAGTLGHAAAMGMKTGGVMGSQVRMPVVITQSIRTQGTMGKGAIIQAGKSPMGMPVQIPGNQKNKLNDPGGGSFRDDDDINDVASMAGVNLNEESARILATNSDLVGTQIRSCKDEAFLHPGLLHRRILETAKKFGVMEVPMEAVTFISHATQSRLRTVIEKVSTIAQHRLDSCKDDECYEQSADVRSQLRFFEQLERMEKQRKDEQEREILLRAAKSRSRQEDPEQARLKQKAKEMQQQELAQMRQRDANLTALAAIGPRKKRKVDSPGATSSGAEVSSSTMGSQASSSSPSTSSRQYTRHRITRVNLRDLIFYMEQEREAAHSLVLYRALLK
ncbi:transcription initiation factor TFIID subunit 4 isoform X2 [Gouania willdenowi]|uniref:transcription initiation factor TFIID subunit 4 isoform X2 n=1 Tax=Gouania willdenowi TaxID=441366 RepID=UPI001054B055|nr:transcription initiation factor TFIID subunit 4-like isoform X2 [Gouania willdenowi]